MVYCFLEFTWGGGELPTGSALISPRLESQAQTQPAPPSGFFSLYSEGLRHLPSSTSGTPWHRAVSRRQGSLPPKGPFRILGYQFQVLCGETLSPWEPGMLVERTLKSYSHTPFSEWSNLSLCINYTQRFGRSIFI